MNTVWIGNIQINEMWQIYEKWNVPRIWACLTFPATTKEMVSGHWPNSPDFNIFNLNIVILVEWVLTRNLVEYLLDYPYHDYPYLDYPDTKRRSMITFTDWRDMSSCDFYLSTLESCFVICPDLTLCEWN